MGRPQTALTLLAGARFGLFLKKGFEAHTALGFAFRVISDAVSRMFIDYSGNVIWGGH